MPIKCGTIQWYHYHWYHQIYQLNFCCLVQFIYFCGHWLGQDCLSYISSWFVQKLSGLFLNVLTVHVRVLVQTSSAATIYVIPNAYHLVTCSDSYIWQNLCWGNCKYVNKMHFIKWRTNWMLSSYINNNRLFNFT